MPPAHGLRPATPAFHFSECREFRHLILWSGTVTPNSFVQKRATGNATRPIRRAGGPVLVRLNRELDREMPGGGLVTVDSLGLEAYVPARSRDAIGRRDLHG